MEKARCGAGAICKVEDISFKKRVEDMRIIVFLSKYHVWSLFLCFPISRLMMHPFVSLILAK